MQEIFRKTFDENIFSDLYYVNENPAVVSTINISKLDGCVVSDKVIRTFNLSSVEDDPTAYFLKHYFFVRLNFQWQTHTIRYFPSNAISRFLFRTNPSIIRRLVHEYDWAIVSPDLLVEIRKIDSCVEVSDNSDVEKYGVSPTVRLGKTTFYTIPDDIVDAHGCKRIIYVGDRTSITPVVHKEKNLISFEINKCNKIKKYVLK